MKGFCFLGEPEGKARKRHLKIVLTEPNSAGLVVVATVTSMRASKRQDTSCVLRKGDHPFVRHDSVVDFGGAAAMRAADILQKQYGGAFLPKPELEPAVLARVLEAAKASRRMLPRIKSMLFSSL